MLEVCPFIEYSIVSWHLLVCSKLFMSGLIQVIVEVQCEWTSFTRSLLLQLGYECILFTFNNILQFYFVSRFYWWRKPLKCHKSLTNFISSFYINYEKKYQLWKKRWFKQWWSTIPPISTKRTITFQLISLNKQKIPLHMTVEFQVRDLGQTRWCGWIKLIHIAMSCNRYLKLQWWKALISPFNVNPATIWLQPPPTPPYPLYVSSKFSIDI